MKKSKAKPLPREISNPMVRAFEILADLPEDILPEGRRDNPPQDRQGKENTGIKSSELG